MAGGDGSSHEPASPRGECPSTPADDAEAARLAVLDRYAVLDTASEPGFDDIVELAAQICEVPIALVSLVDRDRQWFKARVGFAPCQTSLSQSICVHALATDDLLIIPDLTQDPRTRDNTLVTGRDRLRFYAGAVLKTPEGVPFGSLCVIDVSPRPDGLTDQQQAALKTLARQVVTQLELRRALAERDRALVERQRAETLLHHDIDRHEAMIALHAKIGGAAGGLSAILDAVVEGALRVIPAAQGSAVELSRGEELVIDAAAGTLAPRIGQSLPMHGSLSGASLREGRTLHSDRADRDPRIDPVLVGGRGVKALLAAPIARLGEFIGVLKLQSETADAFTPRDVQSAELLAAAIAAGFGDVAETRSVRELRASEQLLRQAQEAGQVGTFSTDIARNMTAASDQFFRLFGLEPTGEAPTSVFEALVIEDDRDRTTSEARRKAGLDATKVEYRIRRADTGEIRWIARGADYLRDAGGQVVSLIGTAQDITDRRWEQMRRGLLLDLDDRFKNADDPASIMATAAEVLGRGLSVARVGYAEVEPDTVHATIGGLWSRNHRRLSLNERVTLEALVPLSKSEREAGRVLTVHDLRTDPRKTISGAPNGPASAPVALLAVPVVRQDTLVALLFAEHDEPRHWDDHDVRLVGEAASRTQDAVERTRAELALRRSEARLLLAQDIGGIGTFEVLLETDEIEASAEMFRLFGLPVQRPCSTAYFTRLVVQEDADIVYTAERRRDPSSPTTAEYRIRRGDDGALRWLRRHAKTVSGRGLAPRLVGVIQDVTDRKLAELELAGARDAAEAANRAKSNFLANMSHELRTPLSAVIGYSEMMEEEVADRGLLDVLKDLGKVKSNARHLLGLINDVLDLSKIEADRMDVYAEDIDVAGLVEEVAGTVGSLVQRRRNNLVLEVAQDVGHMRSDTVKLRQCLLNLLSNACKFTEGGRITFAVTRKEHPDGHGMVTFSVTDTGIGMSEEQVGRLFERFSQADETTTRKFGGTGLGLALTRAFSELLGGTIAVGSRLGYGTCFTLQLPAVLPERSAAARE